METTATSLSLLGAQLVLSASLEQAKTMSISMNVSVCDAHTNEILFARMDNAKVSFPSHFTSTLRLP